MINVLVNEICLEVTVITTITIIIIVKKKMVAPGIKSSYTLLVSLHFSFILLVHNYFNDESFTSFSDARYREIKFSALNVIRTDIMVIIYVLTMLIKNFATLCYGLWL